MSDSVLEFGFEDTKLVQTNGIEQFKQSRSGEVSKITVISFKKLHDGVLAEQARKKGAPLSEDEKATLVARIDAKIAENLKKDVKELTEVDRLDYKSPRFSMAFTHYDESVGTIRCLSQREGVNVVNPEVCCNKFGDAGQTIGTVVLQYPVDRDGSVDMDDLAKRKHTNVWVWKLPAKKFKKLESTYRDARNDNRPVIDLKVTLDGDPKYQKQLIETASSAVWLRDGFDPEVRRWILDQGLRAHKYVQNCLGFEMKKAQLLEKLGGSSHEALSSSESSQAQPQLLTSTYDSLLS